VAHSDLARNIYGEMNTADEMAPAAGQSLELGADA
jgi:hypothetical protein